MHARLHVCRRHCLSCIMSVALLSLDASMRALYFSVFGRESKKQTPPSSDPEGLSDTACEQTSDAGLAESAPCVLAVVVVLLLLMLHTCPDT
jgi:hypothetical protein